MGGAPGREGGTKGGGLEGFLAAGVGGGFGFGFSLGFGLGAGRFGHIGRFIPHQGGALGRRQFGRQAVPAQLLGQRVGLDARHGAVVVDGAGGARRDAVVAPVAFVGIDHVVARVVGDGLHRADGFAGVAADADFRVDQVLFDHSRWGRRIHGGSPWGVLWAV
ncbi:hypothetical protein D9M69_628490 [compost metagenome]